MVHKMDKKMFTVSIDKEYDVMKKEFNNEIYLRVYTSLFKAGIVKDLKPNNFTVLLAIASFMDAEGNCYPTQRQIAEITGLSLPTVNKCINEILGYKVHDKPLIERKLVHHGQFKNSYYTINPISQIAIFDSEIEEVESEELETYSVKKHLSNPLKDVELNYKSLSNSNSNINKDIDSNVKEIETDKIPIFKNSKEVAVYFIEKYREVYGVHCNIAWQRDLSLIKKKILGNYTNEQIKTMIDVTIEEYDKRWKNDRFHRPTISAMVSWIGQEALAIAEDSKKEYEELQDLTADSDSETDEVLKKFGL